MNTEILSVDILPKIHTMPSDFTLKADSRLSSQLTKKVATACKFFLNYLVFAFTAVVLGVAGFDSFLNTVKLPRLFTSSCLL